MDPQPVVLGAIVGFALVLLGVLLRGPDGRSIRGAAVAGLAPVAAVLTALLVEGKGVTLPPAEFLDWVFLAGLAATPIGVLASRGGTRSSVAVVSFLVVAGLLFTVPTESLHDRYWAGRVLLWSGALSLLAGAAFVGRLAAESVGRTTEISLGTGIAALVSAWALGWSGTGITALLVAALSSTAGLFGLMLVARSNLRVDASALGRAMAAPQQILFAGLLARGVLYAETPKHSGAMLLLAPLVALLPGKGPKAAIARLVVVALIAGAAAWLSRGEPNPYGGY